MDAQLRVVEVLVGCPLDCHCQRFSLAVTESKEGLWLQIQAGLGSRLGKEFLKSV